jgi:glutamate-ammonia-ligase adenylyltransferase
MQNLLGEIEFRDAGRASGSLRNLSEHLSEDLQARLRAHIKTSANPDQSLHFFDRLQREQSQAFDRLAESSAALQVLVAVFSHSRFLSEAVLAHPEWVDELVASGDLYRVLTAEDYTRRLVSQLEAEGRRIPAAVLLAKFRRREILRIMVRDVMGLCTLPEITEEISNLADAVLDVAYRRISEELTTRYGRPGDDGFSIISLGKLGGQELNYSSDIDLMFVYGGNGETAGPNRISNKEFYKKVSNQLTDLLSTYTAAGVPYRVDYVCGLTGASAKCASHSRAPRATIRAGRAIGNCRC